MFPDYDSQLLLPIVRAVAKRLQDSGVSDIRRLGHAMEDHEDVVGFSLDRVLSENLMHVVFDISAMPPNKDGSRG